MRSFRVLLALMTVLCLTLPIGAASAQSKTLLYVPFDNRPVSLEYAVDTFKAAGYEMLTPPEEYLANRTFAGDPDKLWQWVIENCRQADGMVVSADALVYGGLVASRTHHEQAGVLEKRLDKLAKLRDMNPTARLYVFSTIMRSPKASAGGVEPPYYDQHGPMIFQLTAMEDKSETAGLSQKEKWLWAEAKASVPADALQDWMERRAKNFKINSTLIEMTKAGLIDYFLLGRDDTSPYSQSHKEGRALQKQAAKLSLSQYASFPGADQLGMIMLTRAMNNLEHELPVIAVRYAPGVGEATVPSYEDQPFGKTVVEHIAAAGGIVLRAPLQPDLIMAVNTPQNGVTDEADWPTNTAVASPGIKEFVDGVQKDIKAGRRVAIADISFANGSDNALLREMADRYLLDRLSAYSGWNTASNTLGYAIGQGMLAKRINDTERKRLLAIRYLDEWAYQANVRHELSRDVVYARGGSVVYLNELAPFIQREAERKIRYFAFMNLWDMPLNTIHVTFPWNRMFEAHIAIDRQ